MSNKTLRFTTTIALILALFVVMLGAYTRLTDAGLGCPDWPGCYGRMVLTSVQTELRQAQSEFPSLPIEGRKAWTEMAHRYAAGSLALLIGVIFISAFVLRRKNSPTPTATPGLLVILVVFQALLGMWTVTLKLLPVVVMGHLLGGVLIFSCLCFLRWQLSTTQPIKWANWNFWVILGVLIVFLQIALGGWVSSNYAGIACVGFPQCNGSWRPTLHFSEGFNLFTPVGANYQGGLLDNSVRETIQFIHRLGAVVTAMYVLLLSFALIVRCTNRTIRLVCGFAILMVLLQFSLGVLNVVYLLPLWVAVAHNGGAALLFATIVSLLYLIRGDSVHAR